MNALLVSHPCETLGVQLQASLPLYERSVGFASVQSLWAFNFGHPCPSLVKGEVLSPTKIRATTGGIVPPSLDLHQPFQNRTIPRLALNLPPLSKGGGLTARHKLLLCCFLIAICSPFLYCKLFCRQDGGIAFLPHPFRFFNTTVNNPSPRTKIASLAKSEVLLLGQAEPTMVGIEFDRSRMQNI